MRLIFSLSLLLTAFFSFGQQTSGKPMKHFPITLGHTDSLFSAELQEKTAINIYLPDGYSPDSATTYPVLYLMDGSVSEDFIHMAGLVQFSSFWWVNYLPPCILVGVVSNERQRDMTFCSASTFKWPEWLHPYYEAYKNAGQSERFMSYMEKELIPYVENNYKCSGKKTLIGQSLAGLFATEVLLKKPTLFNDYIIMSPSLWWGEESLLRDALALLKSFPDTPMQIYIAVGKEGKTMEQDARKLAKIIQKSGKKNICLHFEFLPDEDHGTILHQAVGNAFEKMYKQPKSF